MVEWDTNQSLCNYLGTSQKRLINLLCVSYSIQQFLCIFYKQTSMNSVKSGSKLACLTLKQVQLFSSSLNVAVQPKKVNDAVFIRHAHSQFNEACQDYRVRNNIDYDWDSLCSHPGFEDQVAYNPDYIDCPLTKKGIQQCYLTSQNIDPSNLDVIMVSPHQRALETCANIFKFSKYKFNLPVIVEPLVAGSLWSSCDISKSLAEKSKQFELFDFSRMLNQPELWFIEHLRPQDKKKIYLEIAKRKLTTFKDKQLLVLEMIRNKRIEEDRQILRERAWEIKKTMKNIKRKHCNMLIISHYYIIQYVNTRSFNEEDHSPVDDVDLKNCFPYYNNIDQLLECK